jgi:preprotein translocase subunit SecE
MYKHKKIEIMNMAKRPTPSQFIRQVRVETSKIVWPTRKETTVTTIMVLVFTVIVALFLTLVDQFIGFGLQNLLQMAQ